MNFDHNSAEVKNKAIKPKTRRFIPILIGIALILLLGGTGWFLGSKEGQKLRTEEKDKAIIEVASQQYELGVQELNEGKLETARKRFEYVIKIMPSYPGAQDKLAQVLLEQSIVSTPTPAPLPTMTPTPDFRGEQEIFDQAKQYITDKDWDSAILTLDILRDKNWNFYPVEVDGMYYIALRNRGAQRILQEGSLEPGIYDLTLSERFAPLDAEAEGYRTWARYYLTGASYWGVDWSQVVSIFGELYLAYPNLHDSSGMTAQERYRQGLIKWGDALALQEEYCLAKEKYELSYLLSIDEFTVPTATAIYEACEESKRPKETEPPPVTETRRQPQS